MTGAADDVVTTAGDIVPVVAAGRVSVGVVIVCEGDDGFTAGVGVGVGFAPKLGVGAGLTPVLGALGGVETRRSRCCCCAIKADGANVPENSISDRRKEMVRD